MVDALLPLWVSGVQSGHDEVCMKKESYERLSENERLMYNEFADFALRIVERQEEIIELLKTIIAEANS